MPYHSLSDLLVHKRECDRCPLHKHASQVVLPQLPDDLVDKILWLGRNPGVDEDHDGAPFVGRCGKELDHWHEYLGWLRVDCIIENCVACHTQNNREPTLGEIRACGYWLKQELEILKPKLIIILGKDAALSLGIDAKHGETVSTPHGVGYMLWHPSYLLRSGGGDARKKLYEDLDRLQKVLKNQDRIAKLRRQYDGHRQG